MGVRPWTVLGSERLNGTPLFGFRRDRVVSPRTGKPHDVYVLEAPNWVNVIPVTAGRHVVLVRQWRHGIRGITLEIPGGVIEAGDDPKEAARRELLEETGYGADCWISLGYTFPNPAIQDNRCYTFVAVNAVRRSDPSPDAMEDIEVVLHPVEHVPALLERGEIAHALIVAAFWKFFRWFQGTDPRGGLPS